MYILVALIIYICDIFNRNIMKSLLDIKIEKWAQNMNIIFTFPL